MIRSTIPLLYDAEFLLSGIIHISIKTYKVTNEGILYDVRYDCVNGDVLEFINEKPVSRSWDQIISLNEYLEANYSYTGLNKKEAEFMKIKHALFLETQTKPIFGSTAAQWVLTDNLI